MALSDKCKKFYRSSPYAESLGYAANPSMLQALGMYPYFIPINKSEGPIVSIKDRKYIMLGSNNYLGLASHPRVKEAAENAISKYGTGCTGSRFLNGTLDIHIELEERLASFVGKEKALVFSTGYQVNLGSITAMVSKNDIIIADKEVHASIIDAIFLAKSQNQCKMRFFKHNDPSDLEKILKSYSKEQNKLVVVDGVFSMGGDLAPLPGIVELCKKYEAMLMVDDAHSVGVLGGGKGSGAHYGCSDDIDLIMGTFSKSFSTIGGFIAGTTEVIHWIQHFARSFMFSASLAPSNVATALEVLNIIEEEPERISRVNEIAQKMKRELSLMGYNVGASDSAIVPIIIGNQMKTVRAWTRLMKEGIYTNVALPPAVKPEASLLRTSFMATHTEEQLDQVLSAFSKLRNKILD